MFDTLSEKLQRAFKNLRGQGTITEENIGEALREIRVALLEADVNLGVVKDLIEHIRVKALDQVFDDIEVNVGLEQGDADFAQGLLHVLLGDGALAAEVLEGALQFFGEILKHRDSSQL